MMPDPSDRLAAALGLGGPPPASLRGTSGMATRTFVDNGLGWYFSEGADATARGLVEAALPSLVFAHAAQQLAAGNGAKHPAFADRMRGLAAVWIDIIDQLLGGHRDEAAVRERLKRTLNDLTAQPRREGRSFLAILAGQVVWLETLRAAGVLAVPEDGRFLTAFRAFKGELETYPSVRDGLAKVARSAPKVSAAMAARATALGLYV